jgi:hypothetical protein
MANRSLYYPYIHIRDLSWLKATLLLFEQVRRMTPPGFQTDDDKMIKPFLLPHGGRDPMLYFSDLGSERAVAEQVKLAKHLREDANDPAFLDQFGRAATEAKENESPRAADGVASSAGSTAHKKIRPPH